MCGCVGCVRTLTITSSSVSVQSITNLTAASVGANVVMTILITSMRALSTLVDIWNTQKQQTIITKALQLLQCKNTYDPPIKRYTLLGEIVCKWVVVLSLILQTMQNPLSLHDEFDTMQFPYHHSRIHLRSVYSQCCSCTCRNQGCCDSSGHIDQYFQDTHQYLQEKIYNYRISVKCRACS